MIDQSKINLLVIKFLEQFDTHPITIAEALSKDNYKKSFQLIMENPNMTKEEFLEKMGIEDWE